MDIAPFYEPESVTWTYLLSDNTTHSATIIDPVWVYDPVSGMADSTFVDRVLDSARHKGLRIEWVLETHAHADHLTAAGEICGLVVGLLPGFFHGVFQAADVKNLRKAQVIQCIFSYTGAAPAAAVEVNDSIFVSSKFSDAFADFGVRDVQGLLYVFLVVFRCAADIDPQRLIGACSYGKDQGQAQRQKF